MVREKEVVGNVSGLCVGNTCRKSNIDPSPAKNKHRIPEKPPKSKEKNIFEVEVSCGAVYIRV
jgi:hypothetical protein